MSKYHELEKKYGYEGKSGYDFIFLGGIDR